MDDTRETVYSFLDKISQAKMNDEEWIETTPEIIRHYNRNGLGTAKFFIFDGIKVCETGTREQVEEEMDRPMHYRIHGDTEGKVEGLG